MKTKYREREGRKKKSKEGFEGVMINLPVVPKRSLRGRMVSRRRAGYKLEEGVLCRRAIFFNYFFVNYTLTLGGWGKGWSGD